MVFVGIDPGKAGALVAIDHEGGIVWWSDMPRLGKLVSLARVVELLRSRADHRVFIERQQAMPLILRSDDGAKVVGRIRGTGSVAFRQGESYGQLVGICVALGLPYECVSPQRWQRAVLIRAVDGSPKQRSVLLCEQLFPCLPVHGPRGAIKDGRADAACLAEYGRRHYALGARAQKQEQPCQQLHFGSS